MNGWPPLALACMVAAMVGGACDCSRAPTTTSAPPSAPTSTPTPTSTALRFGVTTDVGCLVPGFGTSAVDSEVSGFVFRELVAHDAVGTNDGSLAVRGDLAASVPTIGAGASVVDGGEDDGAFSVRWTLKPSTWADGVAVSSADVVAGWKVALDPTQPITSGRDMAAQVQRIDVVDAQTFVVVWREKQASFAQPRVHRVLPAHLVLNADGSPKNLEATGFLRRPVGNGAYVVAEDNDGAFLRLKRRPDITGGPAEVQVKIIPSTEALASALLAGDVDATLPQGGLSPPEALRLAEPSDGAFVVARAPGSTWVHLDFNLDDPILGDVRVRQAIAAAIDRSGVVKAVAGDAYDTHESFLPPHHPAFLPLPMRERDVARADALLDDAGLKRPAPGAMRVRADGSPWQLQLAAASGQRDTERLLALVVDQLKDVGVDVRLDLRPFKVFFGEGARKRALPHLSFYAWTVDVDSTGGSLWRADRIPSAANNFAGLNLPGWKNDDVTATLKDIDSEVDAAARVHKLKTVQQAVYDELPALSFYSRPSVVVHRRGVSGLRPTGTATPMAASAAQWSVTPSVSP